MKTLKKILIAILIVAVPSVSMHFVIANINKLQNQSNDSGNSVNNNISLLHASNFEESNDKYKVVDSFVLDDGNYYYFYHLGTIDYVPLSTYGVEGVYFGGGNLSIELKMTTMNKTESIREIKNSIESSVSLTTSTYVEDSISAGYLDVFEAKVTAGIKNEATKTISKTYEESFSSSVTNVSTYEKTISYEMTREDPVGFYFYVPVASVRVYEVVVYNPNTKKVEHMSTYNQFGIAIPGVFYSKYSFLNFGEYDIKFDENKIPAFTKPTKSASTAITIPINANGASCDVTEWSGKIGDKYGELPTVSKHGYVFDGWYADGIKIDENAIVVPATSIEAKWNFITTVIYKTNETISISASHKLNPIGLITMGWGASEEGSLDKIFNILDLATLKDEGYRMRVILEYDVKRNPLATLGGSSEYKIILRSGDHEIVTFEEGIYNTSYKEKKNYSNYMSSDIITGSFSIEFSTKNLCSIDFRNFKITVEFAK